jgi:hypothetical protein
MLVSGNLIAVASNLIRLWARFVQTKIKYEGRQARHHYGDRINRFESNYRIGTHRGHMALHSIKVRKQRWVETDRVLSRMKIGNRSRTPSSEWRGRRRGESVWTLSFVYVISRRTNSKSVFTISDTSASKDTLCRQPSLARAFDGSPTRRSTSVGRK